MNISCHTFVPDEVYLNQYGNYICKINYLLITLPIPCTPFPQLTDTIKYKSYENYASTFVTSTPPLPFVPFIAYDYTLPKEPILLFF